MAFVTMTKTLRNGATLLNTGVSYSLPDSLALELVGRGAATLGGNDQVRLLGVALLPERESSRLTSGVSHGALSTYNTFAGAFKGNTNWVSVEDLPCGVDFVQVGITCDVADPSTYTNVRLYAQTTDLSGGLTDAIRQNPYLGGVAQSMLPVTFGGANSPTFPAGAAQLPTEIWSDPLAVNNTGLNALSWLILKQYYPSGVASGGGFVNVNLYGGRSLNVGLAGSYSFYGAYVGPNVSGDASTNIAVSTAALPTKIRFGTRLRLPALWHLADSTGQGYKSFGCIPYSERYARSRSLAGRPVAYTGMSVQGQTAEQFYARFEAAVNAGGRCDHVVWRVGTANDGIASGYSAATAMRAIMFAHRAILLADRIGATITFEGPLPVTTGAPTAGMTAWLNTIRAFCVEMDGSRPGISSVLYDRLHDSAAYGRWVAAYNEGGDGLHESELGTTEVLVPDFTSHMDRVIA